MFKKQVLSGDSGDGIPGIPGVGPKTAAIFVMNNFSVVQAYKTAALIKNVKTWIRNFYRDYHCIRLLKNINELNQFTNLKEIEFKPHCYADIKDAPIVGW